MLIAEDTENLLPSPFSPLRGQHFSVNVTQNGSRHPPSNLLSKSPFTSTFSCDIPSVHGGHHIQGYVEGLGYSNWVRCVGNDEEESVCLPHGCGGD